MNATGESFFHFIIARNNKEVSDKIIDKNLKIMNTRESLADRTFGHYCYNSLESKETIYCNRQRILMVNHSLYMDFPDIEPRWKMVYWKYFYNTI